MDCGSMIITSGMEQDPFVLEMKEYFQDLYLVNFKYHIWLSIRVAFFNKKTLFPHHHPPPQGVVGSLLKKHDPKQWTLLTYPMDFGLSCI